MDPRVECDVRRIAVFAVLVSLTLTAFAQPQGEALFHKHCINCHGTDLSGNTAFGHRVKIPDLRSPAIQSQSDDQLFAGIGRGVGHREYPHGFLSRGLNAADINAIIAYVRTMKK